MFSVRKSWNNIRFINNLFIWTNWHNMNKFSTFQDANKNDILRPLNDNELLSLIKLYSENFPEAAPAYYFTLNQYKWNKRMNAPGFQSNNISDKFRNTFYTHRGNDELLKNGTIISITGFQDYNIGFFSLSSNCSEIIECFKRTNRIQWDRAPFIESVAEVHVEKFYTFLESKKLEISKDYPSVFYMLAKEEAIKFDLSELPNGYRLQELTLDDSQLINDIWPYRNRTSEIYIRGLIELNGGIGLYNENNNLVSWCIQNDYFGIGLLQTVEREANRGFGKLVAKALAKRIATRDNVDVIAFANISNVLSYKLFTNIGFKVTGKCRWIKLK